MTEEEAIEKIKEALFEFLDAIHDNADATRDLATQIRLVRKEENNE
jgi:predicted RNase H-like HicB family nuclease